MCQPRTDQLLRPCTHSPRCPGAESPAREAARILVAHAEQGWNLLCNGVIAFDDGGDILPGGSVVAPVRYALAG